MARFRNPHNGYEEEASAGFSSFILCLFFGVIYFAVKGNFRHAVASFFLAGFTFGISWLIYPFFVYEINDQHYFRQGWSIAGKDLIKNPKEKSPPPWESGGSI